MESIILLFMACVVMPPIMVLIWYAMWWDDFEGMRSAWEFRKELAKREPLSFEDFYGQYYEGSGLTKDLVRRFLTLHAEFWQEQAALLRPQDDLLKINGGIDPVDEVKKIEGEFGIVISSQDCQTLPDSSIDTLVRFIDRKVKELRSS